MNENGEYDEIRSGDYVKDILEEYKAAYSALGPEEKYEADVQRALNLINLCVSAESLSPELQLRFAGWFMEHAECKHVEEAFCRYLDQNPTPLDRTSERTIKMLDDFWEREDLKEEKKKVFM